MLLDAGADPNQSWKEKNDNDPVTALYGAAGKNHDPEMTRMLLEAGANPNSDCESLYTPSKPTIPLYAAPAGSGSKGRRREALHHQLDKDDIEGLCLMLAYTKDVNDPDSRIGHPLIWAIRRRRSAAHIEALLQAGADPRVRTKDGVSAYVFAIQTGLPEIAELLRQAGAEGTLSLEDEFVAACAKADRIRGSSNSGSASGHVQQAFGSATAAASKPCRNKNQRRCSTPYGRARLAEISSRGGDWSASALNIAVFFVGIPR